MIDTIFAVNDLLSIKHYSTIMLMIDDALSQEIITLDEWKVINGWITKNSSSYTELWEELHR